MAVSWNSVRAEVLSILNMLGGTTATAAETEYSNAVSGTVVSTSTDWPVSLVNDALLDHEMLIIREICLNGRHPERVDFAITSGQLADGANIPALGNSTVQYVGEFSAVIDNTTGQFMRQAPLGLVEWAVQNSGSMFSTPRPLLYCLVGTVLRHTGAGTAYFIGTGANRSTSFSGNIRVRESHKTALVSGAAAFLLTKEGAWPDAQAMHQKIWDGHLASIRAVGRQVGEAFPVND